MNYKQIAEQYVAGDITPFAAIYELKKAKNDIEELIKSIEPDAFDEADRFGGGTFEAEGFQIEIRRGGKMYDFSNIQQIGKIKQDLKNAEDYFKAAYSSYEKGQTPIDEKTGEIIDLPKVTYRKDSIIIKEVKK